jgi:DNA-directed RNA polymerase subunit H (RpoH/RPB5)
MDIQSSLEWLLAKRFGATQIGTLPRLQNVELALINDDTHTEAAIVIDEIRVHTIEALAEALAAAVLDASGGKKDICEVTCIVVWKSCCTVKRDAFNGTTMTAKDIAVHTEIFEHTAIVNHPLLYNIVPQDYHRATDAELAEARRIATPLSRLPIMLESDAVARLLGFKRGDVVVFTRCLGSLPPTKMFRQVTKG